MCQDYCFTPRSCELRSTECFELILPGHWCSVFRHHANLAVTRKYKLKILNILSRMLFSETNQSITKFQILHRTQRLVDVLSPEAQTGTCESYGTFSGLNVTSILHWLANKYFTQTGFLVQIRNFCSAVSHRPVNWNKLILSEDISHWWQN